MNQQPDKLFRDKLESYQKAAPASAWDRIDAGLAKKDKPVLWYRVAAAVLLLAAAAFVLWPRGGVENSPDRVAKKNTPVVKEKESTENNKVEEVAPPVSPEVNVTPENKSKGVEKTKIDKKIKAQPTPVTPEEKIEQPVNEAQLAEHDNDEEEKLNDADTEMEKNAVAVVQPAVKETSVTLIYTAEEVNDKYLDKEALAKATSEKKKSSTFKKLLEKAQDLKNNQDPFGDLRQKKNEILALNFKNDKRGQNK